MRAISFLPPSGEGGLVIGAGLGGPLGEGGGRGAEEGGAGAALGWESRLVAQVCVRSSHSVPGAAALAKTRKTKRQTRTLPLREERG